MRSKTSFLIYHSYYDSIKHLSDVSFGKLHRALYEFNINGGDPAFDGELLMAFMFIKSQFERDNNKYDNICNRNKSNITKRWDKENTKNTTGKTRIPKIPLATKNTDDDTDAVADDDVKEKNNTKKEISFSEGFEKFWSAYPRQRRGSRLKASAAFREAIVRTSATEDEIITGLQRYAASEDVKEGYAKGAQAWLNDDGWQNTYTATSQLTNSSITLSPQEIIQTDSNIKMYLDRVKTGGNITENAKQLLQNKLGKDWMKYA